jgi:hypothetical protein
VFIRSASNVKGGLDSLEEPEHDRHSHFENTVALAARLWRLFLWPSPPAPQWPRSRSISALALTTGEVTGERSEPTNSSAGAEVRITVALLWITVAEMWITAAEVGITVAYK